MTNSYEEHQEAKRQRYLDRADKAEEQSTARYETARASVEGIPLGQPILVGHHSEGRHRAALKRQDTNMRKCIEETEKAEHYRNKAAGVGTGGISSDDPEAIVKLKSKLANREDAQKRMKEVNAVYRKYKKNRESRATITALATLSPVDRKMVKTWVAPYSYIKMPFEGYSLSNNNAEISRIKKRISQLEQNSEQAPVDAVQGDGWTLVENTDENRIQFIFDGKPDADIRRILKQHGFRWSPRNTAWQRQLTNNARYSASMVRNSFSEIVK